jgi:hypothetical protein
MTSPTERVTLPVVPYDVDLYVIEGFCPKCDAPLRPVPGRRIGGDCTRCPWIWVLGLDDLYVEGRGVPTPRRTSTPRSSTKGGQS